ncbi:hypothetical protein AVEN_38702-1 [Araneus ventricosus]|uniref:Uncharacterized protein n=1 Tax=Araneus ventricosus TaxID=182803 RepID=A0A4Y2GS30_ARAVE|nr:hypothetical protein AVEN_38702-1 [Araneus ventricosus]
MTGGINTRSYIWINNLISISRPSPALVSMDHLKISVHPEPFCKVNLVSSVQSNVLHSPLVKQQALWPNIIGHISAVRV